MKSLQEDLDKIEAALLLKLEDVRKAKEALGNKGTLQGALALCEPDVPSPKTVDSHTCMEDDIITVLSSKPHTRFSSKTLTKHLALWADKYGNVKPKTLYSRVQSILLLMRMAPGGRYPYLGWTEASRTEGGIRYMYFWTEDK